MPDTLSESMFGYRTSLPAQLRATSTCNGTACAPGMVCESSNLRTTIAGDLPYLHHRSYHSSGGPVTPWDVGFPDTLANPVVFTEAQKAVLNKGDSLMAYNPRMFGPNNQLHENTAIFTRQMFPDAWRVSFDPWPSLGTNVHTRIATRNLATAKDEYLRGQSPSYGNYGVILAL